MLKNFILVLIFGLITIPVYCQSKFSLDPSIGITTTSYTKTIRPYPSLRLNSRYMFTKVVGVNGGFGLDVYGKSYDIMWLGSIRTRLSNYDKFITHGDIGGGITFLKKGDSPFFTNWKNSKTDTKFNLNIGLVPQYYINSKLTLTSYVGLSVNLKQNSYFDWSDVVKQQVAGGSLMIRFGISYNLSEDDHIDWAVIPDKDIRRIDFDFDKDGVPDSVDICPKVKGDSIYKGCTKEYFNNPYNSKEIDLNIFTKDTLTDDDLKTLDTISDYLKLNPEYTITVTVKESDKVKAEHVRHLLIKRGIKPRRLTITVNKSTPGTQYVELNRNRLFNIFDVGTGEDVLIEFYTVQVCAYKTDYRGCDLSPYMKYGKVLISKSDEWVRHSVGIFNTRAEAYKLLREINQTDAFIRKYKNGKLVY